MDVYTVAFVGHRFIECGDSVEEQIQGIIRKILSEHEFTEFLVGRDGEFDQIVSSSIRKMKKTMGMANCALVLVLPYERAEYRDNQGLFLNYYDEIEIYPGEQAYPKGAIQKRNRYMVDRCDLLLCYVKNESGGACQTLQYAQKRSKEIVNVAELK